MIRITALGVLLMLMLAPPGTAQPEPFVGIVESVEARVNEEVITSSEVDERLQRVELVELGRPIRDEREFERYRQRELDTLIQESLLVQEARRRGWKMDEKQKEAEVELRWKRRVERQGGEARMQQYLAESGLSEKTLKQLMGDEIERDYLKDRLLRIVVASKARVTQEEIEQFKRENPQIVDEMEKVALSHILIAVPENASAEAEAEAEQKAERLANEIRARGSDTFEQLAREYSDHAPTRDKGGNLGLVRRGELFKEFDVAFDLASGEVSGPVRTSQGYHLLKVTEKRSVAERIRLQKIQHAAQEFINRLQDNAVIVVKGRRPE